MGELFSGRVSGVCILLRIQYSTAHKIHWCWQLGQMELQVQLSGHQKGLVRPRGKWSGELKAESKTCLATASFCCFFKQILCDPVVRHEIVVYQSKLNHWHHTGRLKISEILSSKWYLAARLFQVDCCSKPEVVSCWDNWTRWNIL